MMTWEYRDPLEVAARREEQRQRSQAECGQCVHHVSIGWGEETIDACTERKRLFGRQRCWLYEERA